MTVGVHSLTLIEENPAVTTFPPTNKEKQIMTGSEGCNARHTIRYLSADGIETLERSIRRDIQLDILDDPLELIQRLSGLGLQIDIATEIQPLHILETGNDNRVVLRLPHQS